MKMALSGQYRRGERSRRRMWLQGRGQVLKWRTVLPTLKRAHPPSWRNRRVSFSKCRSKAQWGCQTRLKAIQILGTTPLMHLHKCGQTFNIIRTSWHLKDWSPSFQIISSSKKCCLIPKIWRFRLRLTVMRTGFLSLDLRSTSLASSQDPPDREKAPQTLEGHSTILLCLKWAYHTKTGSTPLQLHLQVQAQAPTASGLHP